MTFTAEGPSPMKSSQLSSTNQSSLIRSSPVKSSQLSTASESSPMRSRLRSHKTSQSESITKAPSSPHPLPETQPQPDTQAQLDTQAQPSTQPLSGTLSSTTPQSDTKTAWDMCSIGCGRVICAFVVQIFLSICIGHSQSWGQEEPRKEVCAEEGEGPGNGEGNWRRSYKR